MRLIPVPVQCVVMTTVLELVFSRDANLKPYLADLEGRVFRIHISDTNAIMFLGFSHGKAWVHSTFDGDPDVRLNGTTAGFARMCFAHEDPDELVFQQVLKLSGDSDAMLRFKKLFAAADLDWERELRSSFGDFFGTRVARAAHALVATEQKLTEGTKQVLQGNLHAMDIPDAERLQQWQAGVEHFSHQVSKLKGRVTRLEHRHEHLCEEKAES
ncbi:ubiquinone anaerobic biosynthesis accessory factor UbiT [Mariprofundus aestuarium]|uniref:ubiquinone anaerobic biosynthesis accessory factor UbiT n=1 Tax=Mariprofundus aestuarium TaxID=1921086 RepID=UPI001E331B98|nr:SCP2 sterol-binding domain-containing protein [Mariprofundus aestuarium]